MIYDQFTTKIKRLSSHGREWLRISFVFLIEQCIVVNYVIYHILQNVEGIFMLFYF